MSQVFWFAVILLYFARFGTTSSISKTYSEIESQPLLPATRTYVAPNHVKFAADNQATLYVNGVKTLVITDWTDFAYLNLNLREGDVIAFDVKDFGGWWGFIAELVVNGRFIVTGRDDWLATKAFPDVFLSWTKPSYTGACRWRRAEVRPGERDWFPGKATYFTDPTAARYVWAHNAGVNDNVYIRYRVGGERCAISSTITFAGDNVIELFINGVLFGSVSDWRLFKSISASLTKGDVVAFRVKDSGSWYGAIAAIKTGGSYSTGRDPEWRATKAFKIVGDPNAWMYPSYNACRWPKPVLRNAGLIVPGKAPNFPYSTTNAEYVWAANAGENDTIFLRTVIGVQC